MEDRDKIQALWLNLELIFNALEEAGENVRFDDGGDSEDIYRAHGVSGQVRWNRNATRWEVGKP